MKNSMTILMLALFAPVLASATQYDDLLFFDGIGSTVVTGESLTSTQTSNSNEVSLERQVELFKSHYVTNGNSKPKIIVAHSQGGLRALGFASRYPESTKAVITIGSPVKGHPMLLNPETTKSEVNEAINTVASGASAVLPVYGDLAAFAVDSILKSVGYGNTAADQITNAVLMSGVADDKANLMGILNMALNPSTGKYPGMKDLSPKSDFVKKYISPKVEHTYKTVKVYLYHEWQWVQLDTVVINLGLTKIRQPIYGWSYNAVYDLKQVIASTTVTKKISNNTLVSFLRGTENDPLSFADVATRSRVQKVMDKYVSVTRNAEAIESDLGVLAAGIALSQGLIGNFAGAAAAGISSAAMYSYSARAGAGAEWVEHYKTNLGDILGDRKNDSFIPFKAQSWDIDELGGTAMKVNNVNFVDNHMTERDDPLIWGTGGKLGKAVTTAGDNTLSRLLKEAGLTEPADGQFSSAWGMAR